MQTIENHRDYDDILNRSMRLEGAMGAIAFGVLEMFRRGGMPEAEVQALHDQMNRYFMVPTNAECNSICKMVETRLSEERRSDNGLWYSTPRI